MYEYQVLAIAFLSSFFGSYVGSYAKRKGENLATHEDLDKLLEQMEATTNLTKVIEARISDKVWDRQRQWELKRDALVSTLQALELANTALMEMTLEFQFKIGDEAQRNIRKWDQTQAWKTAINSFDSARVVARLVCSRSSNDALYEAGKAIRSNASKLFRGIISSYDEMGLEVQSKIKAAFSCARQELCIEEPPNT